MNELNFPFFIIVSHNLNYEQQNKTYLIQNIVYNEAESIILITSLTSYFKSQNYIKFRGKPILGIFNCPNKSYLIKDIKQFEKKNDMMNIFIISIENNKKNTTDEADYTVEFPSHKIIFRNDINLKYFYNFYFYDLFKNENKPSKPIHNFFIINGCQPEKFYIIFKKFLNLAIKENNGFILFNAWNNYLEKFYLEPNDEFGFSYLNYFSKALFNINHSSFYELKHLNDSAKIAIQVHLFYEDLIPDIINKVNNIPAKYDLYITTTSQSLATNLENYIKEYSNANNYEILILLYLYTII